jgi:hypothetical protein
MWDYTEVRFTKTGAEVKKAIAGRVADLETRLARRYTALDEFMADRRRLRAYLVRDKANDYPHPSQARRDMPSEDHEEISELCRRICRIEKELNQLRLALKHLKPKDVLKLSYDELTFYGFDVE